ncbi:hypothetical protein BDV25DRAFT_44857 [Aspergillus avenaceus]|uniref:Rhodopsin domain-containing protein n=1 Tax=Aspergillus avenaceus TaxID=36643 RepID=A0A5N6U319_ASPAV|nr:hypothetical protein BDV25DRAFT_44857 [Aspergillus avenaceus]
MDQHDAWLRNANRVVAGVGISINTSLLLLRVYTKWHILRKLWWDDLFLAIAWAFSIGTQAIIFYGFAHAGYGVHIQYLSPATLKIYGKCIFAASIIYVPALAFAKLALLVLYYKLLHATHRLWVYTIYTVAGIITGYSIALDLALIFGCSPLEKSWNLAITEGSCISQTGVYLATAVTNTVSDVVLILIPIPIILTLRLPFVQKLGVACVFGIGCLTIVTSIVRLATLMPLVTSKDQTRQISLAGLFINIEANFIIICNSLPYLRHFLRHHAPRWIGDSLSSRRKSCSADSPGRVRKPGLTQLHDDIERAINQVEGVDSVEGRSEMSRAEVV